MDKKECRNEYFNKRKQLKDKSKDQMIQKKLFDQEEFKNSSSLFITVSTNSEIETDNIIHKALSLNKRVFIPKVDKLNHRIIPVEIKTFPENLILGAYDIFEPKNFPEKIEYPELTIVPGLVFSKDGYRLGYGGGYYDRYLKEAVSKTISLVYDDLVINEIPVTEMDVPVNKIITEKRIIKNDNYRRYK